MPLRATTISVVRRHACYYDQHSANNSAAMSRRAVDAAAAAENPHNEEVRRRDSAGLSPLSLERISVSLLSFLLLVSLPLASPLPSGAERTAVEEGSTSSQLFLPPLSASDAQGS